MTREHDFPMEAVPDLDLDAGEYTVVSAERSPDWDEHVADILTGDADLTDPRHRYDVTGPDDETRLEVLEETGSELPARFGTDDGAFSGRTYRHFLLRTPAGDPRLLLHRGGLATTYALRAAATGTLLATWGRSLCVLGDWQLADPGGTTRATLERQRSLGDALSLSGDRTYRLRASDGTDVARFERTRLDRGFVERVLSELAVTVETRTVPLAVCVALGVSVLVENRASAGRGPRDRA